MFQERGRSRVAGRAASRNSPEVTSSPATSEPIRGRKISFARCAIKGLWDQTTWGKLSILLLCWEIVPPPLIGHWVMGSAFIGWTGYSYHVSCLILTPSLPPPFSSHSVLEQKWHLPSIKTFGFVTLLLPFFNRFLIDLDVELEKIRKVIFLRTKNWENDIVDTFNVIMSSWDIILPACECLCTCCSLNV